MEDQGEGSDLGVAIHALPRSSIPFSSSIMVGDSESAYRPFVGNMIKQISISKINGLICEVSPYAKLAMSMYEE